MKKPALSTLFMFLSTFFFFSLDATGHYGVSVEEITQLKNEDPVVAQHILACFEGDKSQRKSLHNKLWLVFSFVNSEIKKMVDERPHNFKTITSMHKDGKTLAQIAEEENLDYLLKLICEHSKNPKFLNPTKEDVLVTQKTTLLSSPFLLRATNSYTQSIDKQEKTRLYITNFQKTISAQNLQMPNDYPLYSHLISKKYALKNPAVKNHRVLNISENELFMLLSFNG